MGKRRLRTLFYGTSHEHAPGKLDALRKLREDFEVVAVVDDSRRGTPTYRNDPLDTRGFRVVTEEEGRKLEGIDVAFVETANGDLMEIAELFADRGIPMHCDKPCGETVEPYARILAKCKAGNIPLQIGYMYRANPAVRFCWKAVREGLLGDVSFVEADMNHAYGDDSYQRYTEAFRGGLMYNLGCHLVDMVEPLVKGDLLRATPVIAAAAGDPPTCRNRCVSLLEFAESTVVLRSCSRAPGGIPCRRLRIDGSNGTIDLCPIERFDGVELRLGLTLREARGGYPAGFSDVGFGVQDDRYAPQLAELAAIVRGDRANDQDYDRDLRVHQMTLMACGLDVISNS